MGWADGHIARLAQGETVQFRPRGHSMTGKVDDVSAPSLKAWRNAKVRNFNIGIQSSDTPGSLEVPLAAKTVAAIGAIGARIVVTVYAPVESRPMITRASREAPRMITRARHKLAA